MGNFHRRDAIQPDETFLKLDIALTKKPRHTAPRIVNQHPDLDITTHFNPALQKIILRKIDLETPHLRPILTCQPLA